MRAGIYMLFPLVGWEKVLFHEKSWKNGLFYQKGAGILYLSPLDTLFEGAFNRSNTVTRNE